MLNQHSLLFGQFSKHCTCTQTELVNVITEQPYDTLTEWYHMFHLQTQTI